MGAALGEAEVRSALGEPLDVRIPLTPSEGEALDPACFTLTRAAPGGLPAVTEGFVSIDRRGGSHVLQVRSASRIFEPAVAIRVRAACPGQAGEVLRQYALLLDPPGTELALVAPPVVTASAPAAASLPPPAAPARAEVPAATPQAAAVASAAPRAGSARSPASSVAPRARTARPAAARGEARGARSGVRASAAAAPAGEFRLKLSSADVDLSRSGRIDEAARARLRQRLMVLDSDDQMAALLEMRNSLRQLESRVNELQLRLAAMPASFPARTEAAGAAARTEAPGAAAGTEAAPAEAVAQAAPARTERISAADFAPVPPRQVTQNDGLRPWLWGLVAVLASLAVLLAWRLQQRGREPAGHAWQAPVNVAGGEAANDPAPAGERAPAPAAAPRSAQVRYIEARFPQVVSGAAASTDPASVAKAARLLYESGEEARAHELLRAAVNAQPGDARAWLALFDLLRRSRAREEYAALAARFREHHGSSPHWAAVRDAGRRLDPANPVYLDEAVAPASPPDAAPPAPSRALRASLLREAGIDERDLRAAARAEAAPAPLG